MFKNNQKGFINLFIVVIGVLLLGGGVYVYMQNKKITTSLTKENIQQKVISQANTQQVKDGWKTYRNNVLGFEFSYPEYWGDPFTNPEDITDVDSLRRVSDNYPQFIDVSFKNIPSSIGITLFDNVILGDNRYLNSQIIDLGYYEDNIADLRKSGDICDYHISYNHSEWPSVVTELNNVCENGIKKAFIERKQHFESLEPKNLYSYNLNYYAYRQVDNTIFKNALIKYYAKGGSQQKSTTTYEQFLRDEATSGKFNKVKDSDFFDFMKSFKAVKAPEHLKTRVDILSSDTSDVKSIKTYYNLLADNNYKSAFSNLINPSETIEGFVSLQKNIYDQVIKEVNQIGDHTVEVFLDTQLHNKHPQSNSEIFEVTNNNLKKISTESINGKVLKFGNMRTYATVRGLQSVLVLQKGNEEKIIDSRQNSGDAEFGNVLFQPTHFSPSGRYIVYVIGFYEGNSSNVYDILNGKILKNIPEGDFNSGETLYFACKTSAYEGGSESKIYTVPQFSVKTDLLKLHPNLLEYSAQCSNDDKLHIETFEFSNDNNNPHIPMTKVVYKFDSRTGELLP